MRSVEACSGLLAIVEGPQGLLLRAIEIWGCGELQTIKEDCSGFLSVVQGCPELRRGFEKYVPNKPKYLSFCFL